MSQKYIEDLTPSQIKQLIEDWDPIIMETEPQLTSNQIEQLNEDRDPITTETETRQPGKLRDKTIRE